MAFPKTKPVAWTPEIEVEAERILDVVFAAVLGPGEDLRIELKGRINDDLTLNSKLSGNLYSEHSDKQRFNHIFDIIAALIPLHLMIPPNLTKPPRYSADLMIRSYNHELYSAHEQVEARAQLPKMLEASGMTEKEIKECLTCLPSRMNA